MRITRKIGLAFLIVFVVIQFLQPARNQSGQALPTDISKTISVPLPVASLLSTACYDCHSNHTSYPWYANIQPVGWLLNNHIQKGKAALNFNEFGTYTLRRQQSKLKSIASQVKNKAMPLASYTWMHKNAKLAKEDKALITDWAIKSIETIATKNKRGNE